MWGGARNSRVQAARTLAGGAVEPDVIILTFTYLTFSGLRTTEAMEGRQEVLGLVRIVQCAELRHKNSKQDRTLNIQPSCEAPFTASS